MKKELRAHEYYEKPCDTRRRQAARKKTAIRKAALGPKV
jgi:small subunit ribosomal protein S21